MPRARHRVLPAPLAVIARFLRLPATTASAESQTQAMLRVRQRAQPVWLVNMPKRPLKQRAQIVQPAHRLIQAMPRARHRVLRVTRDSTVPFLRLPATTASVDSQIQAMLRVRHRAQRVQLVNTPLCPQLRNARTTV